ncbi:MAG: hypothetical protein WBD37_02470 [Anderseniella sp.]
MSIQHNGTQSALTHCYCAIVASKASIKARQKGYSVAAYLFDIALLCTIQDMSQEDRNIICDYFNLSYEATDTDIDEAVKKFTQYFNPDFNTDTRLQTGS